MFNFSVRKMQFTPICKLQTRNAISRFAIETKITGET